MKRFFLFPLATFMLAFMSLFSLTVLADDSASGTVDVGDDPNIFIHGYASIGNFSHFKPNEDISTITCDHTIYAHHYVTDSKVNYSHVFKLQVKEKPTFVDENAGGGTMDRYDEDDGMPQNYVSWSFFSYIDVSGLPPLPDGRSYTAVGYTQLSITNPDGDHLSLRAEDDWPFWP